MNRPFNLEIERELLRAAEENPGQGLVLGPDGIAKPAEAGLIQAETAGPVAAEADARSRAIEALKAEQGPNVDKEEAHMQADKVLCGLLAELGFADVVAEWEKVDKWYA